jgi:hypothetical protein
MDACQNGFNFYFDNGDSIVNCEPADIVRSFNLPDTLYNGSIQVYAYYCPDNDSPYKMRLYNRYHPEDEPDDINKRFIFEKRIDETYTCPKASLKRSMTWEYPVTKARFVGAQYGTTKGGDWIPITTKLYIYESATDEYYYLPLLKLTE